ncbi:MAG: LLM class flavin-dependent oxidoreductase [Mycetocola sp.]
MTTVAQPVRIGVRFEPDWPPEQLPEFARWAEDAGFHELWFSEDLPWAGGIAMVATALAVTDRIRVGIGLLPTGTRNVATTAMEVAALARLAPGRLTLALGHGIPSWMEQIGADVPRRFAALEETALALRALLAGERVTITGSHVRLDAVQLGFPPADVPPILLGTTGPVGLRVTGRSSDGVLLPEIASPDAVRWARDEMIAAGGSGRTMLLAMTSIGDDREQALAEVRARVQRLVDFHVFDRLTDIAGLGAEGNGELTDSILQSIAIAGTPDDAVRSVTGWIDAGADTIIVVAGADNPLESYQRFANDVLPRLTDREIR